jgi:hypothetical protein
MQTTKTTIAQTDLRKALKEMWNNMIKIGVDIMPL